MKAGTSSFLRNATDGSAVIPDDPVADAQTEPGAITDITRCEERIEDPRQARVIDAVSGVGHRELDRGRRLVEPGGNRQTPRRAAAHRLLGIQNQVQQRLLEMEQEYWEEARNQVPHSSLRDLRSARTLVK